MDDKRLKRKHGNYSSREDLANAIHRRNKSKYTHIKISESVGVSESTVRRILSEKPWEITIPPELQFTPPARVPNKPAIKKPLSESAKKDLALKALFNRLWRITIAPEEELIDE